MRTLVVGAAGKLGAYIATALGRLPEFEIHLGVRDPLVAPKLRSAVSRLCDRDIETHIIDANAPDAGFLSRLSPQLIIDCAGPFQMRSGLLARAAMLRQAHLIDVADARGHISAIETLKTEAHEAGVLAVSGAALSPGVTGALISEIAPQFSAVQAIDVAIAEAAGGRFGDGYRASVLLGLNVPVPTVSGGRPVTVRAGRSPTSRRFASNRRLFANADLAELMTAPTEFGQLASLATRRAFPTDAEARALSLLAAVRPSAVGRDPLRYINTWDDLGDRLGRLAKSRSGGVRVAVQGTMRNGQRGEVISEIHTKGEDVIGLAASPAIAIATDLAHGRLNYRGVHRPSDLAPISRLKKAWQELELQIEIATEAPA